MKALYDAKMVSVHEPFAALFSQGMIQRNGAVMSKSKGNGVTPDQLVERYGADTARVYELFIGPPELDAEWNDRGVDGVARFLNRVWRLVVGEEDEAIAHANQVSAQDLTRKLHETINRVTRDVDAFRFNTAVSALMELANLMQDYLQGGGRREEAWEAAALGMTRMLGPFAPHLAEELWQRQGGEGLVVFQPWPELDQALLRRPQVTIVVPVDGRTRDRGEMAAGRHLGGRRRGGPGTHRHRVRQRRCAQSRALYAGGESAGHRRNRRCRRSHRGRRPRLSAQPRGPSQGFDADRRAVGGPLRPGKEGKARYQPGDARAAVARPGNGRRAGRRDHQVPSGLRRICRTDGIEVGD